MNDWFLVLLILYLTLLLGKAGFAAARACQDFLHPVQEAAARSFTVLQPILSGDVGLAATLESNLLSMPRQCFLWLIDKDDPVAAQTVNDLKKKHPDRSLEILVCPACAEGVNPKLFKLDYARQLVNTPFVLVLDDDTTLPSQSADALICQARFHSISTGLPCYLDTGNFPSSLLAQFVNNNSAMTYLSTLLFMDPITINGMCYVMKSSEATRFRGILHHLTDDFALATLVREEGGSIYQSARPQFLKTQVKDLPHYFRLMHRWHLFAALLLRTQTWANRILIISIHGVHPLMLWALLIMAIFYSDPTNWLILGALLVVRSVVLWRLQDFVFHRQVHKPAASLLSELLQPLHMLHVQFSKTITWRTRRYKVLSNDRFENAT